MQCNFPEFIPLEHITHFDSVRNWHDWFHPTQDRQKNEWNIKERKINKNETSQWHNVHNVSIRREIRNSRSSFVFFPFCPVFVSNTLPSQGNNKCLLHFPLSHCARLCVHCAYFVYTFRRAHKNIKKYTLNSIIIMLQQFERKTKWSAEHTVTSTSNEDGRKMGCSKKRRRRNKCRDRFFVMCILAFNVMFSIQLFTYASWTCRHECENENKKKQIQ